MQVTVDKAQLLKRATRLMVQLGAPANLSGYSMIRDAIVAAHDNWSAVQPIGKNLYPQLAESHGTRLVNVERNIRHCKEVIWTRGNAKLLEEYFAVTPCADNVPSNAQFIARLAEVLRDEE